MAGSLPNSRKVARAARTGGSRRKSGGPGARSYGWYAILALVVVVGVGSVWYSRSERLDASTPGSTPPLAPAVSSTGQLTRSGDHWTEAVGVYTCTAYAPNINVTKNPYGLSTKNDGIIHIAPLQKKYAGHNATVGLFAKAVGMNLDLDSFQLPGDTKDYKPGTKCDTSDGQLLVKEWSNATDESTGKVIKSDPRDLLVKNNAAIAIAWVPKNFDAANLKLPASAPNLASAAAADAQAAQGTTTTTIPSTAATTATTVAPAGTTTPPTTKAP